MTERNLGALGDIIDDGGLRESSRQWVHLGRRRWIVKPEWIPKEIPGLGGAQRLIDEHAMPRLWQLLADYYELLKTGVFKVQPPGWLEAPVTSEAEDLVSETPVALVNGTPVTIITWQVPDRCVAAFRFFGHWLDVAAQFGTVAWTIMVNNAPIRTYQNFLQQRGTVVDPTRLAGKGITLKSKDVITVQATGGATPVNAIARLQGWVMPATSVTQDGTFKDWNGR